MLKFNRFQKEVINFNQIIRFLSTNNNGLTTFSPENYCLDNVKKYDYENYLCSLLVEGNARRSTFAIRAFNVETARIPSLVSDNKIALMRLKFWEETLITLFDKNAKSIPDHPVVKELKIAIDTNKLTKRYFDRLVNARKRPNVNFVTVKDLENYVEESVSSVNYLVLESLGVRNVHADHAASHLGKAQGIVNLLRSIYSQPARSQYIPIPQEILVKHGVSQERFYRSKKDDKEVEEVVFEIATLAHQHLEKSKALLDKVPKEAKVAFLAGVSTRRYLERLREVNFILTSQELGQRDKQLPMAIYWSKMNGTF